jgi:hypothetical protein
MSLETKKCMRTITVIMLNYRRTANIEKILDALSDQTIRPTIWLWNNSGQRLNNAHVDMEVVAEANLHCWPRWFLASYAPTKYVMMIDDDIVPTSNKLIEIVIDALENQANPDAIVGAEGVILASGAYWPTYPGRVARQAFNITQDSSVHYKKVVADVRVDIVKGRCLALRTEILKLLPLLPQHRDMCDDIAVSALLARGRKRAHLVSSALGAVLEDLPDTNPQVALSRLPNWREVRESATEHYYSLEKIKKERP